MHRFPSKTIVPKSRTTRLLHCLADAAWRVFLRPPSEFSVSLGGETCEENVCAAVNPLALWKPLPLRQKLRHIVAGSWAPTERALSVVATDVLQHDLFGYASDYGHRLVLLSCFHHAKRWDSSALTADDQDRANGLRTHGLVVEQRLRGVVSQPSLNLSLGERAPQFCFLAYPMLPKVTFLSLRYFVHPQALYLFRSVRISGHPRADALISGLYDLLFLQQKTAAALDELVRLTSFTNENKHDALLINAETTLLMYTDLLFVYLKATVEKTMTLVGLTHNVDGIADKKGHKKRYAALAKAIPNPSRDTFYGARVLMTTSSEALEDLNTFRNGLLHKKGIAKLQPHVFTGRPIAESPVLELFSVLHEQHVANSVLLLASLALLTDELMRRHPEMPVEAPLAARFQADLMSASYELAGHDANEGEPEYGDHDGFVGPEHRVGRNETVQ